MPSFLEQLRDEEARCWVQAHVNGSACSGVLIRAHLIPAQRIRREFPFGVEVRQRAKPQPFRPHVAGEPTTCFTEVERYVLRLDRGERRPGMAYRTTDDIVWDRRVWVPMCGGVTGIGGHHGMLDAGGVNRLPIKRAWLPAELEEFAEEYGLGWSLEADYGPKET